jgi:hypothetical protein
LGYKKEFVMGLGENKVRIIGGLIVLLLLLSAGNANATGSIGRQVASFCAPAMTMPDVGVCSACHMTANESANDLNAAGMQARSGNFGFFCPATTPPATPPTTPGGGVGMGMSGTGGASGMGMGMGGSRMDDDDDDEHDDDDDDDDKGDMDD